MPHPLCGQFSIELSLPEHLTLSSQIWPLPAPKCAEPGALIASEIPVGDKRREHLLCPSHHHKQFPICHCWISPLFLLLSSFHQPVLILKTVRESNFTIYGKRKQARLIFLSLSKLKSGPQEINSKEIRPHFTHSVNWNNRYKVWKNSNQDRM